MISLTRLNDKKIIINAGLIKYIKSTTDTLITLITNDKIMVKEDLTQVCEKVIAYYKKLRK